MQAYQQQFIEFALSQNALSFGEFTLKSGRISPYFYNAGAFNTGNALVRLGQFYAAAIQDSGIEFDQLFGPAYKGIPLACASAMALAEHHNKDYPYSFNRKEAKDHGEGGVIVGAPLEGKVLLIDDVITAGTAFRESWELMQTTKAEVAGIVVALDRQEKGASELSAIQEIESEYKVPVVSVINLECLLDYVSNKPEFANHIGAIKDYQNQYGIA